VPEYGVAFDYHQSMDRVLNFIFLLTAQVRTVVIIGLENILNSALQIAVQKIGVWKDSQITKLSTLKKPLAL